MNQAKLGKCLYWIGGLGILSKVLAELCFDIERGSLRWMAILSALMVIGGWWILRRAKPKP
jgi:hypothetical protein